MLGGAAGALVGQAGEADAKKKRCKKSDRCPARCACVCSNDVCVFIRFLTDPTLITSTCEAVCGGSENLIAVHCEAGKDS
ncbi:MAG TPA: hypothetical protein VFI22_15140, partial [Thermomicrobiales bacterium]|nr:hypothetical protein [Thermomicrobiales bacterium]